MPAAVSHGAPVRMLATTAPMKTPGHRAYPPTSTAARAIPLGGQTNAAKPEIASILSPTRAARTYSAAITKIFPANCSCEERRVTARFDPARVPALRPQDARCIALRAFARALQRGKYSRRLPARG